MGVRYLKIESGCVRVDKFIIKNETVCDGFVEEEGNTGHDHKPNKDPTEFAQPVLPVGVEVGGEDVERGNENKHSYHMIHGDNPSLRGTCKEGEEVVRLVEEGVGGGCTNNDSFKP